MDQTKAFTIGPDPKSPDTHVFVVDPDGREWRIFNEDADPEHRFVAYRLAAGWFGNLPAGYEAE